MVVLIPLSLIYLLNLFSSSSEGEEKEEQTVLAAYIYLQQADDMLIFPKKVFDI